MATMFHPVKRRMGMGPYYKSLAASLAICSAVCIILLLGFIRVAASPNTFTATGPMSTPRTGHTLTLLRNGMVLAVGGSNGQGPVATAELYHPATSVWSRTGSLSAPRMFHGATL